MQRHRDAADDRMRIATAAILAGLCLGFGETVSAKDSPLVELKLADRTVVGRSEVVAGDTCWVMTRDGRLEPVDLREVTAHRQLGPQFKPYGTAVVRDLLRREFPSSYEVVGGDCLLIVAPQGTGSAFLKTFDDTRRAFQMYFSVRGFSVARPEFPLVAVVHPSREQFVEQCRQDGFPAPSGLAGYYLSTTNRIALYDDRRRAEARPGIEARFGLDVRPRRASGAGSDALAAVREAFAPRNAGPVIVPAGTQSAPAARDAVHAAVSAGTRDTLVHEAIHQFAFNAGLHARLGENPKWIVEGLATVMEADGVLRSGGGTRSSAASRINKERFERFAESVAQRRQLRSLGTFLASDAAFGRDPLDAYAEAWALVFLLIEKRPAEFSRYLKHVAGRPAGRRYEAAERLADFQKFFGKDVDFFEVRFLRDFAELQTQVK